MIIFGFGIKKLIEIVQENKELHRALGDIYLTIHEAKKGNTHISIKHDVGISSPIFRELIDNLDVIKDHWKK